MHLSNQRKYQVCQVVAVMSFVLAVFMLYRLSGAMEAGAAKPPFIVLCIAVVLGVATQIAAIYFRSQAKGDDSYESVEVETLAATQHQSNNKSNLL